MKRCDTATNSLDGSANIGDVEEGLTTALDRQKPPVNDLRGKGAQTVLNLKMTYVIEILGSIRADTNLDPFNARILVSDSSTGIDVCLLFYAQLSCASRDLEIIFTVCILLCIMIGDVWPSTQQK
jgi:hypothetical protein